MTSRPNSLAIAAAMLAGLITPGTAHADPVLPLPLVDDLLPIPGITRPPLKPPPGTAPDGRHSPDVEALPELPKSQPGPGRLWALAGQTLTLHGLQIHGTSTATNSAHRVSTLRVSADRIDITSPVQRSRLANTDSVTRISADQGQITPSRAGQRVELEIRQITGTLAVAGQPAIPILIAAPPLAIDLTASVLDLPELTLTNADAQVLLLSNGELAMLGARISINS